MEPLDFDEPLPKVTCTTTKCEDDLHCFRPKRAKPENLTGGKCYACEVELVDWTLMHSRDIAVAGTAFALMRQEFIREHFWTIPLDAKLKRDVASRGRKQLAAEVEQRLRESVMQPGRQIFRDGTQTPTKEANIIYYAQHATATCCRKCIKYWHGIPYGQELTADELLYFQQLIGKYIDARLPDLPEGPQQLPLPFSQD